MPTGIYQRKPVTQTTKNKISKALKQAWAEGRNTGITGMKHTKATKLKMSQNNARAMLGKTGWNKGTRGICKPNSGSFKKGIKHTELWKKQHSDRMKVLYYSKNFKSFLKNTGKSQFKKGCVTWNKGMDNYLGGDKHYNWQGGISFEPYPPEFNNTFKRGIRKRDNHICMLCKIHTEKLNRALDVHHINYNKKLTIPQNCISLCNKCHVKTNYNRTHWTKFFQSLLTEQYGYIYSTIGDIIIKEVTE